MTIVATIFFTCLGLLIIGAFVDVVINESHQSIFNETVTFLVAATAVILFIAIVAIGFYTGDIKEWVR